MEYLEGQNLREKIEAGPLKLAEAIKFATQIAEGLPRLSFFNTKGKSGRMRRASRTATSKAPAADAHKRRAQLVRRVAA